MLGREKRTFSRLLLVYPVRMSNPAIFPSNLFHQRGLGRIASALGCVVGNPGQVSLSSFNALEGREVRLDPPPWSARVDPAGWIWSRPSARTRPSWSRSHSLRRRGLKPALERNGVASYRGHRTGTLICCEDRSDIDRCRPGLPICLGIAYRPVSLAGRLSSFRPFRARCYSSVT